MSFKEAKGKISKTRVELNNELRKLRRLPKSAETDAIIKEKELKRREASTTGTIGADTSVVIRSYTGKIVSVAGTLSGASETVNALYYKREDQSFWMPWMIATRWTEAQALNIFSVADVDDLQADHCEFYESNFEINDDGTTNLPDELNDEDVILDDLGLSNTLGYFLGGDEVYHNSPVGILRGQTVLIVREGSEGVYQTKGTIEWNLNDTWNTSIVILLTILLTLLSMGLVYIGLIYTLKR